jgi:AcrR family transcriptional regulator
MSPGHIYHFFENKEAIIAAIVEREMEAITELVDGFDKATDIFNTMIQGVDQGLERKTRPQHAALWIEVWAETARNPDIAQIVRTGDNMVKTRLEALHGRARQTRGLKSAFTDKTTTELIMALFSGLSIRTVLNPEMDKKEVAKLLKIVVKTVLEA